QVGLEVLQIWPVLLVGEPFAVHHPLVPGGQAVQSPVDEQPEAPLPKPCEPRGRVVLHHRHRLLFRRSGSSRIHAPGISIGAAWPLAADSRAASSNAMLPMLS